MKTIYASWGPGFVFVPHPDFRSLYMKVDRCVIDRPCPHCGSERGVPCVGKSKRIGRRYQAAHHYHRGKAASDRRAREERP